MIQQDRSQSGTLTTQGSSWIEPFINPVKAFPNGNADHMPSDVRLRLQCLLHGTGLDYVFS